MHPLSDKELANKALLLLDEISIPYGQNGAIDRLRDSIDTILRENRKTALTLIFQELVISNHPEKSVFISLLSQSAIFRSDLQVYPGKTYTHLFCIPLVLSDGCFPTPGSLLNQEGFNGLSESFKQNNLISNKDIIILIPALYSTKQIQLLSFFDLYRIMEILATNRPNFDCEQSLSFAEESSESQNQLFYLIGVSHSATKVSPFYLPEVLNPNLFIDSVLTWVKDFSVAMMLWLDTIGYPVKVQCGMPSEPYHALMNGLMLLAQVHLETAIVDFSNKVDKHNTRAFIRLEDVTPSFCENTLSALGTPVTIILSGKQNNQSHQVQIPIYVNTIEHQLLIEQLAHFLMGKGILEVWVLPAKYHPSIAPKGKQTLH